MKFCRNFATPLRKCKNIYEAIHSFIHISKFAEILSNLIHNFQNFPKLQKLLIFRSEYFIRILNGNSLKKKMRSQLRCIGCLQNSRNRCALPSGILDFSTSSYHDRSVWSCYLNLFFLGARAGRRDQRSEAARQVDGRSEPLARGLHAGTSTTPLGF